MASAEYPNAAVMRDERHASRDRDVRSQVDEERLGSEVDPPCQSNITADRPELEEPDATMLLRCAKSQATERACE